MCVLPFLAMFTNDKEMPKLFLILVFALGLCQSAKAQEAEKDADAVTAAKCFSSAPVYAIPMVSLASRLDMLDYYEAGSDHPSVNFYGGDSRIISLSDRSLTFMGTDDIECQVFVLDPGKDTKIGVITTYPTPIPDSSLKIYNRKWQLCNDFKEPKLADWLLQKKDATTVAEELPFIMASYHFDTDTNELTVTNNMAQYFAKGHEPEALGKIKPTLTYKWNGKYFKLK